LKKARTDFFNNLLNISVGTKVFARTPLQNGGVLCFCCFYPPSELAEHRNEAGGCREPLFEPEARCPALGEFGSRPAS
jgi:hypothetical protein